VYEQEENIRNLNLRISQSRSREDTLRHQLEEKNKEAETHLRRFNKTTGQLAELQTRLAEKEKEADENIKLLRRTHEQEEGRSEPTLQRAGGWNEET
jgi:predicted  nucleic acid-binding Zn-ribbon protein